MKMTRLCPLELRPRALGIRGTRRAQTPHLVGGGGECIFAPAAKREKNNKVFLLNFAEIFYLKCWQETFGNILSVAGIMHPVLRGGI